MFKSRTAYYFRQAATSGLPARIPWVFSADINADCTLWRSGFPNQMGAKMAGWVASLDLNVYKVGGSLPTFGCKDKSDEVDFNDSLLNV